MAEKEITPERLSLTVFAIVITGTIAFLVAVGIALR